MALITCTDLNIGYDGKVVRNNLNFSVNSGDYLCIIGQNGSGKSTLVKTILGLQKPLSGKISLGDGLKKNMIGYLPQQTVVQKDFPTSVEEIVLSGCKTKYGFLPFYTKQEKALAKFNMERMYISNLAKKCYRELSGGQQQRVLLARALCATEKIILLDEPVAGLDPRVSEEMYNVIEHLNKDEGITVIMISHDIHSAIKYSTHILELGKDTFFGTTKDYLQKEGNGQ